jgi:hypothetical protein
MAKQIATSLDHAAACKQTFTDWETRLAKILGEVEMDDSTSRVGLESSADLQQSASVDAATAEWQVCKSIICISYLVLALPDLNFVCFLV